jgi:lysophospholipase
MSIHTEVHQVAQGREPKLAIVLIHGAADHCGRYGHVIAALTAAGYAVVTGDLPGHGRTEGLSGHVESFDEYLECVDGWVQQAQGVSASGRVAMVGHSMGGLVAVRYLQERAEQHPEVVCAVVTSPCLKLVMEVPGWKQWLADRLNKWSPRLRMASGIDPANVSRTREVVEAYGEDPLCGGKVSVRWFQELNGAMAQARAGAEGVKVPLLMMQSGDDRVVDARASDAFFQELQPLEGHAYVAYPQCYHELFNEPEQQQVIEKMVRWLEERTVTF